MKHVVLITLLVGSASTVAFTQRTPRTPGHVGGSTLNPTRNPRDQAALAAANLTVNDLSPQEQAEFRTMQRSKADLTVAQFLQIHEVSRHLQAAGHNEATVTTIAATLGNKGNDLTATVKEFKVTDAELKSIVAAAKKVVQDRASAKTADKK